MECSVCGQPGEECGFCSNEVCTTIVCEDHRHLHPKEEKENILDKLFKKPTVCALCNKDTKTTIKHLKKHIKVEFKHFCEIANGNCVVTVWIKKNGQVKSKDAKKITHMET